MFEEFDGDEDDPIFYIVENQDNLTVEETKKLIKDYDTEIIEKILSENNK